MSGKSCLDINRRNLFCFRLHFVLKERIGIAKISTNRFLITHEAIMHEGAQRYFAGGRNFETTVNTMMISRHDSHRKMFGGFAIIGLQHCGQVTQVECSR